MACREANATIAPNASKMKKASTTYPELLGQLGVHSQVIKLRMTKATPPTIAARPPNRMRLGRVISYSFTVLAKVVESDGLLPGRWRILLSSKPHLSANLLTGRRRPWMRGRILEARL